MKKVYTIIIIIFLIGCTYTDEHQLVYVPVQGIEYASSNIDTARLSLRMRSTDFSGSSDGLLYSKIRSKGPYIIDFSIKDFVTPREEAIIHSARIIEPLSQNEFLLISENLPLKLPFEKTVNGYVISWNVFYSFKEKPYNPVFTADQKLSILVDMTIIPPNTNSSKKVQSDFMSKVKKFRGLLPLSAKYGP